MQNMGRLVQKENAVYLILNDSGRLYIKPTRSYLDEKAEDVSEEEPSQQNRLTINP